MREVPDITISRDDVVVDSVIYRPAVLGLFGRPRWQVCWRSATQPGLLHCQLIDRDCRAGSAVLGDQPFSFLVRWRADRRRSILKRYDEDMVTPQTVLQLAEISNRN